MSAFVLSYMRPLPQPDGRWAGILIGVYSSLKQVDAAKERLRQRPGFRDFPDGFQVTCLRFDEDYDDPMFFANWEPET